MRRFSWTTTCALREIPTLEAVCQGDHGAHEGLRFLEICNFKRGGISRCFVSANWYTVGMKALQQGVKMNISSTSTLHRVRASVGSQPKISKFPTLVSEYKEISKVTSKAALPINEKRQLTQRFSSPAGAKVLRSCLEKRKRLN